MLQLGVAGVGQQFSRYRETLRRLRNPVEIDAIYDSVFARAEAVATREEAALQSGLRGLASRHSVEAVLLLDPGWHGLPGLRVLASCRKPVFVAPWVSGSSAEFELLHEAATTQGVSVMPALWRRYLPTAVRVQELIATEIGAVSEIDIELSVSATGGRDTLVETVVGWLDFCRNLFRTFPVESRLEPKPPPEQFPAEHTEDDNTSGALNLIVDYPTTPGESAPSPKRTDRPRRATVSLVPDNAGSDVRAELLTALSMSIRPEKPGSADCSEQLPLVRISCERGWAEIRSASEIAWQIGEQRSESEKLTADRAEHDIMLDLFCRRVAGGLIPVPDFFDVSHALRMLEEAVGASAGFGNRNSEFPDGNQHA